MRKPKITEGEWTIENHDHIDGEVWLSINKGAIDVTHNVRDDQIASQKFSITDNKERVANAKAISAVPEMIDALIECYKDLKETEIASYNVGGEMWESDKELLQRVEQALKKAGVE